MIKRLTSTIVIAIFLLSFPCLVFGEEITHSMIHCGGPTVRYHHSIPSGSHDRQFCHVEMSNRVITQIDACFDPDTVPDGISLYFRKPNGDSILIEEYDVAAINRKFNHMIPWYADGIFFVIRHNKDAGSSWDLDLNTCRDLFLYNLPTRWLALCEGDLIDLKSLLYEGVDYYILDIGRNIEYLSTDGTIGIMSQGYERVYLVKTLTADGEVMVETVVLSMSSSGAPDVSLTLSRDYVCVGDSVYVYVRAPDNAELVWNHDFAGVDTLRFEVFEEITLRVNVHVPGLCVVILEITIHMKESPLLGHQVVVCQDALATLAVESGMTYQSWFTIYGDYIDSTSKVEVYPNQQYDTTWYFVEVGDTLGCHFVDSVSVVISRPANAGPDQNLCLGKGVMVIGSGGDEYNWNDEGFSRFPDYVVHPDIADGLEQIYQVEVLDEYDCISTDSVTIYLQLCCEETLRILFPNIVTLNDDGINDVFTAFASDSSLTGVSTVRSFFVLNRSGAIMHEVKNFLPDKDGVTGSFNGQYKGKKVANGVYLCAWEVECYDGSVLWICKSVTVVASTTSP
ncbi:MAG: hypothetical protein ACI83D_000621 [Planctomycetota bacterium]|jgi:hypothetical protein